MRTGLLAEFLTVDELVQAIVRLRATGYRDLDAFSPYPIPAAERALELPRSPLTWRVLPYAVAGGAAAYAIQWYCNAFAYPLNVGGRPLHSAPAWIPITFEMTVLLAGVAALLLFFALSRLPELHHPLFAAPGFERASIDRFFLGVDDRDPLFDRGSTARELEAAGAARVVSVWERP